MADMTYAAASDLSDVVATPDGFGSFTTKLSALDFLIARIEGEREELGRYLANAKRQRRAELKKEGSV